MHATANMPGIRNTRLLIDLLPEDDGVIEAIAAYLEWWCAANAEAHTKLTTLHLDTLVEEAFELLVGEFGARPFMNMPKVCHPAIFTPSLRWHVV